MMSKYRNQRVQMTCADGVERTFDSKREAARWNELYLLECAGVISELVHQPPPIQLIPPFEFQGKRVRALTYQPDFAYRDADGTLVYEDVKGGRATQTAAFRLKWKLLQFKLRDFDVRLVISE